MFSFIKDNLFLWFIIFLLIVAPSFLFGAVQIVVYILFGIFLLGVGLYLYLQWKIRKFREQTQGQYQQYQESQYGGHASGSNRRTRSSKGSDDVEIFTTPQSGAATEKKVSEKVGDYVDFEEIN